MTHPISLTRPLLVHLLAAVVLCPLAFARTKNSQEPAKPAATVKSSPAKAAASVDSAKPQARKPDKSSSKDTPADSSRKRQNQGDAPAKEPALDHRALIVPPDELLARVPASGPLNEENCILLAIANSPELSRRRAEIQTAIADRRAIQDWKNPELRLGYGSQSDDYVRFGSTPGNNASSDQGTFSALVRFQMPQPWQKKAKLERAASEIMLAESQYLSAEDKVVREVRAKFMDLNVKQSTWQIHQKRRDNFLSFRKKIEGTPNADFAVDAVKVSLDIAGVLEDSYKVNSEADAIRTELARLCGIRNAERIHSGGIVTRRILDPRDLSQSYLVEMAMLYRSDAVESRGRLGIARALLAEANAGKVPWATFIDVGDSHQTRDGYFGSQDEWVIRLGIEIPLFDWTRINKRDEEYRKAAVAWEEQFNTERQKVEVDVALALGRVRRAKDALYAYESSIKTEQAGIQERLQKSAAVAEGVPDHRPRVDDGGGPRVGRHLRPGRRVRGVHLIVAFTRRIDRRIVGQPRVVVHVVQRAVMHRRRPHQPVLVGPQRIRPACRGPRGVARDAR